MCSFYIYSISSDFELFIKYSYIFLKHEFKNGKQLLSKKQRKTQKQKPEKNNKILLKKKKQHNKILSEKQKQKLVEYRKNYYLTRNK